MKLSLSDFKQVVKHTPLIAIDLIVKSPDDTVLLGKRINEPAKGVYFVPGGRVYKDETLSSAFQRITETELNCRKNITDANVSFLGVYEHFYKNSFADSNISTHYIVLGYCIKLDSFIDNLPNSQHGDYIWLTVDNLLQNNMINYHSKLYFKSK